MLRIQKPLNKLAITKKMNKPKSLYIHIPFCEKICDYCDFTKLQYFRKFAIPYLDALEKELKSYQIDELYTIYVGGGTPTALEDDLFEKLLKIVYIYAKDIKEYTIEANPESLSINKIKMLKKYGVSRISLGVQTTNDKILKAINRDHSFSQVKEAIKNLKENGLDNINVDLILGLPHSSHKILKEDLKNILDLGVKHISCYGLTVNPHTVLYNKGFKEPEGDLLRKYYDIVNEFLIKNGFIHYEVSNWSKPGYESKHNLAYWRNHHYYGCGLGASGYIDKVRYKNTVNLDKYLEGNFVSEKESIYKKDKIIYQIMLNLRTNEGIDVKYLKDKEETVNSLIGEGLLIRKDDRIIPTYEGMMILDQIILKLL